MGLLLLIVVIVLLMEACPTGAITPMGAVNVSQRPQRPPPRGGRKTAGWRPP